MMAEPRPAAHPAAGVETLMAERSLVAVVDDDVSVRESLPDLLRELGFSVRAFASAEEFLASGCVDQTRCMLVDVAMQGMSGPDLLQELQSRRKAIPIVFITGQLDDTIRPRVLRQGAVECLNKPFSEAALMGALNVALQM
jgi:FixJ family two-component response regulator